jgi:hypothetical protein
MAHSATGPFTHPDDLADESYPNALFTIVEVHHVRGGGMYGGLDSLATYEVYASQAKKNAGKRPRYRNTFPFDYVPGNGNIIDQALTALKTLPEYPGLVDA